MVSPETAARAPRRSLLSWPSGRVSPRLPAIVLLAAVAAIAFTAAGRLDHAKALLHGVWQLQNDDGSWEFAYDVETLERWIGEVKPMVDSA